jgi:hypothetical protein
MKRFIFFLSLSFWGTTLLPLAAQTPEAKPRFGAKIEERIKAQHIAFISNRLQLTPKEAEQFWPLFNEFHDKQKAIRKAADEQRKKPFDEMTDTEVEKMIASELDIQSRELELRKEYYQKFKTIISVKKIAKLYRAERDFRMSVLDNIKRHRLLQGKLDDNNELMPRRIRLPRPQKE